MASGQPLELAADRFFGPDEHQKEVAVQLYQKVSDLPIVSPHGHVDPRLFSDPNYSFGSPVDMLIIPDHYVFRMLHSQGVALDALGIARRDGGPVESDHRKIWQIFADNFFLFRGTPSGVWLSSEFYNVFGIREKLTSANAQAIYDQIAEQLNSEAFRPRKLFERFKIEVLCTTDAASDSLEYHAAIRASGWNARILPTFRPDAVVNLETENWRGQLDNLSKASGLDINGYKAFIQALENRRAFFKQMGAKATDHAATNPYTNELSASEAEAIFQRALKGETSGDDAARFLGHMLMEMARMSTEDGLVMQLHTGSLRNHNQGNYRKFGLDKGADIPVAVEFTRNLHPLLNKYGSDPRLSLILFTLDESPYARELAPLVGHYPAVKLGPPWWFHDSLNGITRYFDQVIETAGLYNTCGFNDDTRAFASIPARHDLWRRASANWVAGMVVRNVLDMRDAEDMILDLATGLARKAYKLD